MELEPVLVNGKNFKDLQDFIRENDDRRNLEKYEREIWNAMTFVQFNESEKRHVEETRDELLKELFSLKEFLKTIRLFYDKAIKKVDWGQLDRYREEILHALEPILLERVQEIRKLHSESLKQGPEEILYLDFVTAPLESIAYPKEIQRDEGTKLMTKQSLDRIAKTIAAAIDEVRKVVPSHVKATKIIWKIYDCDIRKENKYYRAIYDVLEAFGCIPRETVEGHKKSVENATRESYVKAALKRKPKSR